jgi:taurine-pyruvate aminotransferase
MVCLNTKNLNADELVKLDKEHFWHHLTQHKVFETKDPMIVTEGEGLIIKDIRGKEYIDATSGGVWCVNVGYGRESIAKAVYEQLKTMAYYAGSAGNVPAILLAEKITSLMPGISKVYYSNSGSEANEKAFKMVRQGNRKRFPGKEKIKILYRDRDYHGTTLAALSATGQEQRKENYGPFLDGFKKVPHACCYRCPFGKEYPNCEIECAKALEEVILKEDPDTVGAYIVEPITAGGGVIMPVPEYYKIVQEICRKYDVLLIMDEVVNGFGRTGKWFGYQHYDVEPDIVTMAKGMASAYAPLSATVTKQDVFDIFLDDPSKPMDYFRDISTYGGCAGSFAAALESVRIMEEEKLCENSAKMGEYFIGELKELSSLPVVGDVRGKGLFAGIELVEDKTSKTPLEEGKVGKVIADIAAEGVLVGRTNRSFNNNLNNTLAFAPALVADKAVLDKIVNAVRIGLEKACK